MCFNIRLNFQYVLCIVNIIDMYINVRVFDA